MRVLHGPGDPGHEPGRRPRVPFQPGDMALKIAPIDQFEAEEREPAYLSHLEDWHDVRMVEPRDGLGLDPEPLDGVGTGPQDGGPNRLECDHSAGAILPRLEHHPHPALGDLFQQLEIAKLAANPEFRHRVGPGDHPDPVDIVIDASSHHRPGHILDPVFVGEERGKILRDLGMESQEPTAVGRAAGLDLLEIVGDGRIQPLLVLLLGRIRRRVDLAHAPPPIMNRLGSSSRSRRCFRPRLSSPATALGVRSRCMATSASEHPRQ